MDLKPALIRQVNFDNSGLRTASDLFNRAVGDAKSILDTKVKQDTDKALSKLLTVRSINELPDMESLDGAFVDTEQVNDAYRVLQGKLQQEQYKQARDAKVDSQWEKEFDFKVEQESADNEQFNKNFEADRQNADRNYELSLQKTNAYTQQLNLAKNKQDRELKLGKILAEANMPQAIDNALASPEMYTLKDGRVDERMATIVQSPEIKSAIKGAMDNEGNITDRGWKFVEGRFRELGLDKNDFLTYKSQYTQKIGNPVASMRGNLMSQLGGVATPKDIQFADTLLNTVSTANSPDTPTFQSILARESEQNARRNTVLPTEEFTALADSILGDYGGSRNKDAVRILLDAQSRKGDLLTQAEARAIIEAGKNDGLIFDTFSESDSERLIRELFKK